MSTMSDTAFNRLLDLTSQLVTTNAQLVPTESESLRSTTLDIVNAILNYFVEYERA